MTKESEDVIGATWSSQNPAGKVSKTCGHIRWGLGGVGSESDMHDPIMSHKRGHVQRNGWRNGYEFVIKVRNIIYDKKPLQQVILEETTIWATHEEIMVSESLNFFNKIISELRPVDVKLDEEDNVLILLSSLSELYCNHHALRKENSHLGEAYDNSVNKWIRKRPNLNEREGSDLVVMGSKGGGKKIRFVKGNVIFVTRKITGRRTASISKSGWRRKGKLRRQT